MKLMVKGFTWASLLAAVVLVAACATGPQDVTIQAQDGVDLSAAAVERIYPELTKPGTLFVVMGEGFGLTPAPVYIGDIEVTEFIDWSDEAIFFRTPRGVQDGDTVIVGNSVSDAGIVLAPSNSITVVWEVDFGAAQDLADQVYESYGLNEAPQFEPPFYIKGQWTKYGGTAVGTQSQTWDGGARISMANRAGTDVWFTETVFSPDAVETFGGRPMQFAFEDANTTSRRLSSFESDAALILKDYWAKNDAFTSIGSDPAVRIDTRDSGHSSRGNTIFVQFP
ncbi:hypothetical protein [Spirochaeta africana]|uniref:IPT/TIG domain-containing protein n=1 Tax=Spirochaeta africana (strain ATCC 700263 / DSM 8902 / Z-7692) TaxID=889378 RepID=H9UFW1_SPIAZ|nr:hypothetical protein [Spirochaeta africana]AFG36404.1 hypothetical protein Spiaf_0296 [Spirochaeta africana DSM 8902]